MMTGIQKWAIAITALLVIAYIVSGLAAGRALKVATDRLALPAPSSTYKDDVAAYGALTDTVTRTVKAQYDLRSEPIRHVLDAFLAAAVALLFGKGVQTLAHRRLEILAAQVGQPAHTSAPK